MPLGGTTKYEKTGKAKVKVKGPKILIGLSVFPWTLDLEP